VLERTESGIDRHTRQIARLPHRLRDAGGTTSQHAQHRARLAFRGALIIDAEVALGDLQTQLRIPVADAADRPELRQPFMYGELRRFGISARDPYAEEVRIQIEL
jgi:hypothetical protein